GETGTIIRRVVPARIRRRGVEQRLILDGADKGYVTAKIDTSLIKAVIRAYKWFDDLVSGRAKSLIDIAKAEGISARYVSHVMPLAFLAPEIVEAILNGMQPVDLTAETLIKRIDVPLSWAEQNILLGFD
ncbi:MAG: hypothetical protein RLP02_35565, partial [Coleofasciculus sp. C2-GNP5-27]